MERHGAELERDADDDENEAKCGGQRCALLAEQAETDRLEFESPGDSIKKRDAVQQGSRGDRAKHEILHGRFRRHRRIAIEGDERVERERQQLEPEVHRQHVPGRDHDHDPEQPEQRQDEELAAEQVMLLQIVPRIQEDQCDHEIGDELEDSARRVGDEAS